MSMSTCCSRQLDRNATDVNSLLNGDVQWLCKIFLENNHEIRIVGGAVRDMLMKRQPKDIDLSTTATPEEMVKLFNDREIRYIETGLQHGTLTAHINEKDYEVTTLRVDTETDGRKAVVQYTKDWFLDAQRRDLTVNAMSVDIDGFLYDYFNGEEDLKGKKVRFVGETSHRIKEDFLRILRYFRFYGKIDADIDNHDDETLQLIKELSSGLQKIAVERIWVEVKKIIIGPKAPHLLELMYKLDVARNIGLPDCRGSHFTEFSKVWYDTKEMNPEPVTLLCTLVNTIEEATELCLCWKLSNYEKDLARFIVAHRYISVPENTPLKPYQDFIVSLSTTKTVDIVRSKVQELLNYEGKLEESKFISNWNVPIFPVTGNDIKKCGISPGPNFGRVLNKLKEMWIESYYTLSKEHLMEEVKGIYEKIHK